MLCFLRNCKHRKNLVKLKHCQLVWIDEFSKELQTQKKTREIETLSDMNWGRITKHGKTRQNETYVVSYDMNWRVFWRLTKYGQKKSREIETLRCQLWINEFKKNCKLGKNFAKMIIANFMSFDERERNRTAVILIPRDSGFQLSITYLDTFFNVRIINKMYWNSESFEKLFFSS